MGDNGLLKILEGFQTKKGRDEFLQQAARVGNKEAAFILAEIYENKGDLIDAAVILKKSHIRNKELFSGIAKKLEKKYPYYAVAIYQNIRMDDEAIEVYKNAYDRPVEGIDVQLLGLGDYFRINWDRLENKLFEPKNKEFIDRVIKDCQKDKNYKQLAAIHLKLGNYADAIEYLELTKDYKYAAEVSLKLKDINKAIRYYKRAHKYKEVTKLYEKLNNYKNALMFLIKEEKGNIYDSHINYAIKHGLTEFIGKKLLKKVNKGKIYHRIEVADYLMRVGWVKESRILYKSIYKVAKNKKDYKTMAEAAVHLGLFREAMICREAMGEFDEARKMAQKARLKEDENFYKRLETILNSSKRT